MRKIWCACLLATSLLLPALPALADSYSDTISLFKNAGASASFVSSSYGYAVFPTIGKGGIGLGGAYGEGRVYKQGKPVGETSVTQVSLGLQLGGQAYSEMIFFQDKRAFDEFTSGNFSFSGNVSAVAITSGASASAGTDASTASASGGRKDAATAGAYQKGMAVFTIAKGGLMYEVSVSGQKFSYKAK